MTASSQPPLGGRSDPSGQAGVEEAATSLCTGCGLCCDGTFLDRGLVRPDQETKPIEFYRNEFSGDGEQTWFSLPCPHYEGGHCTIYDSRFATCRIYRCDLLKKLDSGEVTLSEAQRIVGTAKSLVTAITDVDPNGQVKSERTQLLSDLNASLSNASAEERQGIGRRIVNIFALNRFLDQHFYSQKRKEKRAKG